MIQPRLAELLEEKGMTLYKLAQETRLAYSTLHKLSKGRTESIDFRVLDGICTVLDCHPGDVLIRIGGDQNADISNGEILTRKKRARSPARSKGD
jgi:putative transcriptional regulator